jgi:hypothetical protein
LGALPLAYNTPNMKKVIVLMTDGNNEWYDWPCGVPGQTPSNKAPLHRAAHGSPIRLMAFQPGLLMAMPISARTVA